WLVPPGGQDAAPVVPGDRLDLVGREAHLGQGVEELGEAGDAFERGGERGAVEVGAEADVLDADPVGDVAGVLGDRRQRRVGIVGEVLADEGGRVDDPDQAVGRADRVELRVGQVAGGGGDGVG